MQGIIYVLGVIFAVGFSYLFVLFVGWEDIRRHELPAIHSIASNDPMRMEIVALSKTNRKNYARKSFKESLALLLPADLVVYAGDLAPIQSDERLSRIRAQFSSEKIIDRVLNTDKCFQLCLECRDISNQP